MNILNILFIFGLVQRIQSSEWIDTSDMVDSRIIRNRYRHSTPIAKAHSEDANHVKKVEVVYQQVKHRDYVPKNPFPNTDSCLDESLQIEDSSNRHDRLQCISNKLKSNTDSRLDDGSEQVTGSNERSQCNQLEPSNPQCHANGHQQVDHHYKVTTYYSDTDQKQTNHSEMLNTCLLKNKQLTEDLVCFRNLKSLYTRYLVKINGVLAQMKENSQKIEIHPYSTEFFVLLNAFEHENCLR